MNKKMLVLSTGFALFSMFFGSGNLVFPLLVGQQSNGHFLLASLGIILTGVLVPFLGALGIMLYKGSHKDFFSSFGKVGIFLFSLVALSLMGPFGVAPRCFTVAHGALQTLLPSASLVVTSLIFCVVIYVMTLNKNKVIPALGSILTPLLLLSIAAIVFFAFKDVSQVDTVVSNVSSWSAFKNGFFQGYQTMDLLAAFFFSTFVINHLQSIRSKEGSEKASLKIFLQSACVGGGVLAAVYMILVLLGSRCASMLQGLDPQQMLGHIAMKTLGSFGAPCLCLMVVLACFTTAIVLVSLFADFLHKEVAKEKISFRLSLLITLAISFTISTIGFAGITKVLGPIIAMIYPALIVLTVLNIAHKFFGLKNSHWPVTITLALKGLLGFV